MAQTYQLPVGGDKLNVAIKTHIANSLEALRSCFSGASEPSSPVAYQFWADTTTGYLKLRNGANSAWLIVQPLAAGSVYVPVSEAREALLSASLVYKLGCAQYAGSVKRLCIVSDTTATGTALDNWSWMLTKRTAAAPGTVVNLFSAAPSNYAAVGGIGGGALTAYAVQSLTPNQNSTVAADDLLLLNVTANGTPGTLTQWMAWVELQ